MMSKNTTIDNEWSPAKMVEIKLNHPEDFLIIMETLTRMGIASHNSDTLTQTCHILQKRGLYYIVHYKELFMLDNWSTEWTINDILHRNKIVALLHDWKFCEVNDPDMIEHQEDLHNIMILAAWEKKNWRLVSKYKIGKK